MAKSGYYAYPLISLLFISGSSKREFEFLFPLYVKARLLMDFFIYGRNCCHFFTWDLSLGPKLNPRDGCFGPWPFFNLKKLHQDLSNEESNFILSPLEVGHWVALTQPFLTNYLKSQILAAYNNLRIGWICWILI